MESSWSSTDSTAAEKLRYANVLLATLDKDSVESYDELTPRLIISIFHEMYPQWQVPETSDESDQIQSALDYVGTYEGDSTLWRIRGCDLVHGDEHARSQLFERLYKLWLMPTKSTDDTLPPEYALDDLLDCMNNEKRARAQHGQVNESEEERSAVRKFNYDEDNEDEDEDEDEDAPSQWGQHEEETESAMSDGHAYPEVTLAGALEDETDEDRYEQEMYLRALPDATLASELGRAENALDAAYDEIMRGVQAGPLDDEHEQLLHLIRRLEAHRARISLEQHRRQVRANDEDTMLRRGASNSRHYDDKTIRGGNGAARHRKHTPQLYPRPSVTTATVPAGRITRRRAPIASKHIAQLVDTTLPHLPLAPATIALEHRDRLRHAYASEQVQRDADLEARLAQVHAARAVDLRARAARASARAQAAEARRVNTDIALAQQQRATQVRTREERHHRRLLRELLEREREEQRDGQRVVRDRRVREAKSAAQAADALETLYRDRIALATEQLARERHNNRIATQAHAAERRQRQREARAKMQADLHRAQEDLCRPDRLPSDAEHFRRHDARRHKHDHFPRNFPRYGFV